MVKAKKTIFKKFSSKSIPKKTQNYFLNISNQNKIKQQSQQSNRPVGRPRMDFKHKDPQTGQPIPATLYYKRIKQLRRQAEQNARIRDIQQVQELARKGIPPQQAQQIVDQRQLRNVGVQQVITNQQQQLSPEQIRQIEIQRQMQNQNQMPNGTVIPMGNRIWKFQRGVVGEEGGLFGKVKKIYGSESSFWN